MRLIRTYKHPNKGRDQNEKWLQWEAGMATSSAPTVFPPFLRANPGSGVKQVLPRDLADESHTLNPTSEPLSNSDRRIPHTPPYLGTTLKL